MKTLTIDMNRQTLLARLNENFEELSQHLNNINRIYDTLAEFDNRLQNLTELLRDRE